MAIHYNLVTLDVYKWKSCVFLPHANPMFSYLMYLRIWKQMELWYQEIMGI